MPPSRGRSPRTEGAKRRQALVRNAAPGGLALRQNPSLQRKGTASPSRGPARLSAPHRGVFPQSPGPPSGNGQGRPYGTPLIPRAFTRVHPLPPARCRTDPCSWAGRCLPRPPEARLARPNPQAPSPLRQQAPPVDALCEQRWLEYRRGGCRKSSGRELKSVNSERARRCGSFVNKLRCIC